MGVCTYLVDCGSHDFHVHCNKNGAIDYIIVTDLSCLFQLYSCPVAANWCSNTVAVICLNNHHCRSIIDGQCMGTAFSTFAQIEEPTQYLSTVITHSEIKTSQMAFVQSASIAFMYSGASLYGHLSTKVVHNYQRYCVGTSSQLAQQVCISSSMCVVSTRPPQFCLSIHYHW